MEIKDIQQLRNVFRTEAYLLKLGKEQDIHVGGVKYIFYDSSTRDITDLLKRGGSMAYTVQKNQNNVEHLDKVKNETGLNNWLVFGWWPTPRYSIVPANVITTTAARGRTILEGEEKDKYENKILGSSVQIHFTQFPRSKSVQAKIDTGATVSSIHGESIQIDKQNERVSFRAPFLSNNTITVPVHTNQAVKSPDGGVQYRPVILLDVNINGQRIPGIEFNINDRSHMSHDVLIGQNILQKGKFLINPSLESEEIDWAYFDELLMESMKEDKAFVEFNENTQQLTQLIMNTDLSLKDIIKYIKTETIQTLDEISY